MITWTGQATVHSKIKLGAARIVQPQHSRTGYFACAPMQHLISNAAQFKVLVSVSALGAGVSA